MTNTTDPVKGNVKTWRLGRIHWVQGEKSIAKGRTEKRHDLPEIWYSTASSKTFLTYRNLRFMPLLAYKVPCGILVEL